VLDPDLVALIARRKLKSKKAADLGGWTKELFNAAGSDVLFPFLEYTFRFFSNLTEKVQTYLTTDRGLMIDHEKITKNPFTGQPVGIGKAKNQGYVPADRIAAILPSCPNNEWRLLFVFARFAGMRCPSEPFQAKWSAVDWERGRMLVDAPKKKDQRVIPLFPELRKYLEEYHADLPESASDWMLPNLRETSGSLHAPASKIIMRAKQPLWPRLFHNLRSSCQTDLCDKHPLAAVCAWLGNSATVAARHYLQVTEAHFEAATRTAIIEESATTFQV
jgi:integrase